MVVDLCNGLEDNNVRHKGQDLNRDKCTEHLYHLHNLHCSITETIHDAINPESKK